jgi:hypothetical protein
VGWRSGHGTGPALVANPYRTAVGVRRLGLRIAENVVGEAEQGAQSFG